MNWVLALKYALAIVASSFVFVLILALYESWRPKGALDTANKLLPAGKYMIWFAVVMGVIFSVEWMSH